MLWLEFNSKTTKNEKFCVFCYWENNYFVGQIYNSISWEYSTNILVNFTEKFFCVLAKIP